MDQALGILAGFLEAPLDTATPVLERFAQLPGAIARMDGGKNNFVYIPGARDDRVLLVAHADTVWDEDYIGRHDTRQRPVWENGIVRGSNPECGIGADDRAGCAMLWLLRGSGHSLLVTDGEEHGQIGAHHIEASYPALFDELNRHSWMLQLDRRGDSDYKVYSLPVTEAFIRHVAAQTGYADAGRRSRTDIVALCRDICGVNLSIGYFDEHTPFETLSVEAWKRTLERVERMLAPRQNRFPMAPAPV